MREGREKERERVRERERDERDRDSRTERTMSIQNFALKVVICRTWDPSAVSQGGKSDRACLRKLGAEVWTANIGSAFVNGRVSCSLCAALLWSFGRSA